MVAVVVIFGTMDTMGIYTNYLVEWWDIKWECVLRIWPLFFVASSLFFSCVRSHPQLTKKAWESHMFLGNIGLSLYLVGLV